LDKLVKTRKENTMPKPKDLAAIGAALDEISFDWLSDYHPVLAEAIEAAVGRGVDAQQIRRYVMAQTQRIELALRCEQAARWLAQAE